MIIDKYRTGFRSFFHCLHNFIRIKMTMELSLWIDGFFFFSFLLRMRVVLEGGEMYSYFSLSWGLTEINFVC